MEVHHPHHPNQKKKIKEYLIEFFMLFTAVTLGFFAENVREVYVEKERAHELVERFKKDVRINVAYMDSLITVDNKIEYQFGSEIVELMSTKNEYDLNSFFTNVSSASPRFLNKNDTYEQMKNSGSLRYIKDEKLLEMMIDYSDEAEATEYRSKEQEASYLLGTFADLIVGATPPNIAIKNYMRSVDNLKARLNTPDSTIQQLAKLTPIKNDSAFIISGPMLQEFKNKMIAPVTRRLSLMRTTIGFLVRTRKKGQALLDYLEEKHY
jgi:hypothetical protein